MGTGGYFDENDPEWAVSQLAAHRALPDPPRRRARPQLGLLAGVIAVALVLAAGVFLLGDSGTDDLPISASLASTPPKTQQPTIAPRVVAPQVTLTAVERLRRPPTPSSPSQTPIPPPSATPAATPVTTQPDGHAGQTGQKPGKDRKSNRVGPNRPLKSPYDPDEH